MTAHGKKSLISTSQIGFHYYQDTTHYTTRDLTTWLPELSHLSASWLILQSDTTRAIPEHFITGLINANITPIVQFPLSLPDTPSAVEIQAILEAYARWGVEYVVFFDRPNDSSSWSSAGWNSQDLVERFIDRFLPLAIEADQLGMTVVFPPLQPGGSYWDTSFFKSSIQSLQRRGYLYLIEKMVIGSYAYTFGHELSWGLEGPEKWTLAKPYSTPAESQDQRGFYNYVWYQAIAASLGVEKMPVIQFGVGIKDRFSYYSPEVHAEIIESMIHLLQDDPESLVLSCNFWLLAAEPYADEYEQAWIKSEDNALPIVRVISPETAYKKAQPVQFNTFAKDSIDSSKKDTAHPIAHYLLLPTYEWGVSDWHLDITRSFVRKYQPTIGFSIQEAALAQKVTVIGGDSSFSSESISTLRNSGCIVDQITGDGTSIATQLLER